MSRLRKGYFQSGRTLMLATGIALLAVGLSTSNPGFWIPGTVFIAIGAAKRMRA